MTTYVIRRILSMIPIMLIVSITAFMFVHLTPGDPIRIMYGSEMDKQTYEEIKEREGFNGPLIVQYGRYMGGLFRGDLGTSYRTRSSVSEEVARRFGFTFNLAMLSMVWAIVLGLGIGILSAVKRNSIWDRLSMVTSISLLSMPSFWMGLVLMQIFAVGLGWLPTSGTGTFKHLLLPSIVLGTGVAAVIARFTRSSVLETMKEDYIRTARSKGQKHWKVIWKHALRNALIPVVTMTGLQFGFLIGGAVVVEQVFSWPGLGSYLVDAILVRDYPVIQALIMLFSLQFLVVNLLVDLTYAYLNPQIRYD
ncbi:ABC transporter permease subunit [Alkalicella caledoniensis]|uniref:Glutathione transport system permease protein GsiC n=1 Tax=Alkalicella caledoniensis TaxID=2731377 RepID=A0A7G9W6W7_ALKCA|nr:nickel ABC transporter permease [Alkalicella caledoniensis]QNO14429.1 ABC transporter permease subunit [Alkalicella caledoniensis]